MFLQRFSNTLDYDIDPIIPWLDFDDNRWETISSSLSSDVPFISKSFVINFDLVKNSFGDSTINTQIFKRKLFYVKLNCDEFEIMIVFELVFNFKSEK